MCSISSGKNTFFSEYLFIQYKVLGDLSLDKSEICSSSEASADNYSIDSHSTTSEEPNKEIPELFSSPCPQPLATDKGKGSKNVRLSSYLAGLVEGDGSIAVHDPNSKSKKY